MLYFITISRKKNSTDRSFSFSTQRENKYACVRSEHFEQLDHEHKPTTVCLPSRKNESTTLPLLLPRTMASIVYLEIEAACNESSLEIVDAPSKSGCAGIKRRHCLPPSYPVRLERHLAEEVEDRLSFVACRLLVIPRDSTDREQSSDPSPRQWRGRDYLPLDGMARFLKFFERVQAIRSISFDALTKPLQLVFMFNKVIDIRNENIFLGMHIT